MCTIVQRLTTTIRRESTGNVYVLKGQADFYQGASTGYIKSPHFPLPYPSDYSVEYQLVNTDPRGFVQLVFTDFQLSPWSYIEVSASSTINKPHFDSQSAYESRMGRRERSSARFYMFVEAAF